MSINLYRMIPSTKHLKLHSVGRICDINCVYVCKSRRLLYWYTISCFILLQMQIKLSPCSNLAYALLGRLLSQSVAKMEFEEYVHEKILTPLNLMNTGFTIDDRFVLISA